MIELFYIGMPVVRTDGRAYGHVITKFSQMGRLPHFLTHGAPLRAHRALELRYHPGVSLNKGETAVPGCHCPGDMAVRMREVLARPWVGVCVPLALGFSIINNLFTGSLFSVQSPSSARDKK